MTSGTTPYDKRWPPELWPATVEYLTRRWVRIEHPLGRKHPNWIATAERMKARGFKVAPPSDLDDRDAAA